MDYYKQIKDKILDNEAYERIKDYSKERHRVLTYYEIGKLLHEAGKHYGEGIIKKYAYALEKDFSKKYNERSLRRMRQFYILFCEPKWSSLERNSSNALYNKANFNQKWSSPSSIDPKVSSPNSQALKTPYIKGNNNQKVSSLSPTTQIVTLSNAYTSYPTFITSLT